MMENSLSVWAFPSHSFQLQKWPCKTLGPVRCHGSRQNQGRRPRLGPSSTLVPVTLLQEVGQQSAPLRPELVGSGQTAVASDHAQVGDAQLDQVAGRRHAALPGAEVLAAGTANDRPALMAERADEVLVTDRCLMLSGSIGEDELRMAHMSQSRTE